MTELILREQGLVVNRREFQAEMAAQKARSRSAASVDTDDWIELINDDVQEFVGYDYTEVEVKITRYRKVVVKNKAFYHLVFNITPFYAEGGGQIGDSGELVGEHETVKIIDTKKENGLTIHVVEKLPEDVLQTFVAKVDRKKRILTANNHTATHLLDYALRKVLGTHVEQKGSYVSDEHLRFDFSHFQKVTDEELAEVASIVNQLIRRNLPLEEFRSIPIANAREMGALAVFGEKYGDLVRVIKYGDSIELCGGTHVAATGQIGFFKILSESSVSAGVRRIEAITADKAEEYINNTYRTLREVEKMFKSNKDLMECVRDVLLENEDLKKETEKFARESLRIAKERLKNERKVYRDVNVIVAQLMMSQAQAKDIAFQLKGEYDRLIFIGGGVVEGKPYLMVMMSNALVDELGLNAGQMVREAAQEIKGGGGGQPFFATAGGSDPSGVEKAIARLEKMAMYKLNVD